MSELDLKLRAAEKKAANIIEQYGIRRPEDIRIEDIAYDNNVVITEGGLKGAAASIVKYGNSATIRIPSDEIKGRNLFSISHELGHFFLDHIHSLRKICSDENMLSWHSSDMETQANFFAGELLMPKTIFSKYCDVKEVKFIPVKNAMNIFKTSLTATAIRFVRFCPEQCAIIFSKNGKIKWCYKSKDWLPFININKLLDKRSLAYDFFVGNKMHLDPEEVAANAWFDERGIYEVVEHSIPSRNFGFTLTLLWIRP